ncbi:unnamed protein product [Linum trigynum]|uniref:Uncharacterized protein n=1 Tax=Linum trigynum TaxID=586398 RepID=A0AAV2GKH1_9ROSI
MQRSTSQLGVFFFMLLLAVSSCFAREMEGREIVKPLESTNAGNEPCKKIDDCNAKCARRGCTPYYCSPLGWCWCILPISKGIAQCY